MLNLATEHFFRATYKISGSISSSFSQRARLMQYYTIDIVRYDVVNLKCFRTIHLTFIQQYISEAI